MSAPAPMPQEPALIDAPTRKAPSRRRPVTVGRLILVSLLALWGGTSIWHANKPLPPGTHVRSEWLATSPANVSFIADITAADAYSRSVTSQSIFDEVLRVVRDAERFLVIDYFLFNAHRGADSGTPYRALSSELRDALILQKQQKPDLRILFITDPINDVYGGDPSKDLDLMRAAGIDVVVTDLDRLRDSNLIYSAIWRLALKWWSGDGRGQGWLPNPLDEDSRDVTFRAWARLANFKANH